MVHPKILAIADIDQAVVTGPAIRMNYRTRIDVTLDNPLQCGLGAVEDDPCIAHALAFKQAKANRRAVGAGPRRPHTRCWPKQDSSTSTTSFWGKAPQLTGLR